MGIVLKIFIDSVTFVSLMFFPVLFLWSTIYQHNARINNKSCSIFFSYKYTLFYAIFFNICTTLILFFVHWPLNKLIPNFLLNLSASVLLYYLMKTSNWVIQITNTVKYRLQKKKRGEC